MNTPVPDDLDTLTDSDLDNLFATEYAGWCVRVLENLPTWCGPNGEHQCSSPWFTWDPSTVLPHLMEYHWQAWTQGPTSDRPETVYVAVYPKKGETGYQPSAAPTFARAAVLALLRNKRSAGKGRGTK